MGKSKRIAVLLTLLITLAAMAAVYSMEFTVSASTDESLEAAINDYNFTTDVAVNVLTKEETGKYLFVLYSQTDHAGWGGIAKLERGFLGKYRFQNCDNTNWQLYQPQSIELGRKHYLLLYGLNDLPQVASFTVEDENQIIVHQSEAYNGPFIDLIEMQDQRILSNRFIRYYDGEGAELSVDDLWDRFQVSDTGDGASVGSAELSMIYVFLGIILLIGLFIARSIWKSEAVKKEE